MGWVVTASCLKRNRTVSWQFLTESYVANSYWATCPHRQRGQLRSSRRWWQGLHDVLVKLACGFCSERDARRTRRGPADNKKDENSPHKWRNRAKSRSRFPRRGRSRGDRPVPDGSLAVSKESQESAKNRHDVKKTRSRGTWNPSRFPTKTAYLVSLTT